MSFKYSDILDEHMIGYFPFDDGDITKCYGTKADLFEVNPRSNILINVDDLQLDPEALAIYNQCLIDDPDGTLGNWKAQCEANPYYKRFVKFDNIKAITTPNVENNDYYDIKINQDLTTFTLEFFMNVLNFEPVPSEESNVRQDVFLKIITENTAILLQRIATKDYLDTYGLIAGMKNAEDEEKYVNSPYFISDTNRFLHKNIHIPYTITYDKNKNSFSVYVDGEIAYFTTFKEDIGKIKNIMFYTGWGTDYPWQHSYTNIIISDIIRYGLENNTFTKDLFDFNNYEFIPVSKDTFIPSYRISKINYSLIKNSVTNTNFDIKTNRNIEKSIEFKSNTFRYLIPKIINPKFNTITNYIVNTEVNTVLRKNVVTTVNLKNDIKRDINHTFIVKKIAFVL